uniref:Epidermal growth factor n=1 Tax=Poecilia reticulata TaxID=8081 RepID=A0A3P9P011_POERE
MSLDGQNHRWLSAGTGSSILLDFHFREESLYWADRRTGIIYKASLQGAHRQKLYSSDKHVSGLTVDWVGNGVFWTSSRKGQIKKMDLNGKNEKTILKHLSQPSFINVDPTHRLLFWLSGGSEIQRSDLSGQMKMTVLKLEEQLEVLSVDREDKRLFWVQLSLQGERAVASCDYSGNSLHIIDLPLQSQSLGISVFLENVYYTDAAAGVIRKINKYTGGRPVDVNDKPMVKHPVDIKVVHPLIQPMADTSSPFPGCNDPGGSCVNVCSRLEELGVCQCSEGFALSNHGTHCEDVNECAHWNHGCSLGCENIPGSYFCTCPKGYTLLPDGKTCQGTEQTYTSFYSHSFIQNTNKPLGCSSADRGGCSQLCSSITPSRWQCGCLPGYRLHQDGKRCTATGPPAFLIVANLLDVRRMNTDGMEEQTLVKEPRGTILALDFDPVYHRVYFASTSQRTIERVDLNTGSRDVLVSDGLDSPEGLAIDWHLLPLLYNGLKRKTVVKEGLEEPRGIAVHPQKQLPTPIAKGVKLFWTDTGAQPVVESATLEGSSRVIIASTGRPFDLAVFEDRLWISEWEHQQIRSVHKRTGQKLQRIHGSLVQPASVVVVHPLAKPGANVCLHLNGGCAQKCESNQGLSHCSCLPHFTLSADGKSCLSVSSSNVTAESGDETSDLTSLKNKTLHEESIIPLVDQNDCYSLHCAVNARCVLDAENLRCLCQEGFTGDGQTCLVFWKFVSDFWCVEAESCFSVFGFGSGDSTSLKATSQPPMDVTTRHHNSNSAEKCPPSHDAYCLYHGVCVYFPEIKSYACNCVRGYIGERCQFSDLEWLELRQAEKEKERNLVIGGCMVALISIISITACITYCFRSRRLVHKQTSEDDVSEISVTDESMSETTTTSVPRVRPLSLFYSHMVTFFPHKFKFVHIYLNKCPSYLQKNITSYILQQGSGINI